MIRRFRSIAIFLVTATFAGTMHLAAQPNALSAAPAQPFTAQQVQDLLQRLAQAEARIQSLESKLTPQASATAPAAVPSPNVPPEAHAAEPADPTNAMPPTTGMLAAMLDHSAHDAAMPMGPSLQIRGFGDFTYAASNLRGTTNSFTLGQFDLFMSSKLSEHWNFVAESVIQGDKTTNTFGFEIERLMITYHLNDYLNAAFGRYHQKIGYYNTAYHHGTYFQTSVGRPFIFEFEDGGGILPIHNVGVSLYGKVPSGKLGLHWVAEVGNGRTSNSPNAEFVQNVFDENNRKSVNIALFARPEWVEGLEVGGSVLKDRLYPTGFSRMNQTVSSAYVAYDRSGMEILNEVVIVGNDMLDAHRNFHNSGFYSQVSHKYKMVRPFVRYEYLNVNDHDPIFGSVGRRSGPLAGVRFEVGEFSAFKVQYGRTFRSGFGTANSLTGQIAFAF